VSLIRTQFGSVVSSVFDKGVRLVSWAADNPTLPDGSSLFEATECVDPPKAMTVLEEHGVSDAR
jgi:hypothetical protein